MLCSGEETDDRLIGIYQNGVVSLSRSLWPRIYERGNCSVVYVALRSGNPTGPLERASSEALGGLMRVAAAEGGIKNIRANMIVTDGKNPEGLADAAVFFACGMSSYISGVTLNIDGCFGA